MPKKIQIKKPIINIAQSSGGNWYAQIIDTQENVVLIDEKHIEQAMQELAVAKNRIKIDKLGKREITVIISKADWKTLLRDATGGIRIYPVSDLHHYFGDYPEEYIQRVEIREVKAVSDK